MERAKTEKGRGDRKERTTKEKQKQEKGLNLTKTGRRASR